MAHPATQRTPPQAWHWADIKAALAHKQTTLTELSLRHQYSRNSLHKVQSQNWPKAQKIIADALGVQPQTIWPDRYDASGAPIQKRQRSTQICTRQGQKRLAK